MSRIEYLIQTNNITVLGSYFNLANKSNLSNRLLYDLIQFFNHLVVAYFLGLRCRHIIRRTWFELGLDVVQESGDILTTVRQQCLPQLLVLNTSQTVSYYSQLCITC